MVVSTALNKILEAIKASLASSDLVMMVQSEGALCALQEKYALELSKEAVALKNQVALSLKMWKENLLKGDYLDVLHADFQTWYNAKILENVPNSTKILVHYQGWDSKFDEIIDVSVATVFPPYTVTKKKQAKSKGIDEVAAIVEPPVEDVSSNPLESIEPIQTTKSGRILKNRSLPSSLTKKSRPSVGDREFEGREIGDRSEWICSLCGQLEARDGSVLLLCDGACLRSFHVGCLNIVENEVCEGEWKCHDCSNSNHSCFLCGEKGSDNIDVHQCSATDCGKYYHIRCLENTNQFGILSTEIKMLSSWTSKGSGASRQFSFKCPYHRCENCFPLGIKRKDPIQRCLLCPMGYHANCIPPGARFSPIALLCGKHPTAVLPTQDRVFPQCYATDCNTTAARVPEKHHNKAIKNEDSQWKRFETVFEEMVLPIQDPRHEMPFEDHHFRLPVNIRDSVINEPKEFKMISKLVADNLPKKSKTVNALNLSEEACYCVDACDKNCVNRISRVECHDSICNVKGDCGNRHFRDKCFPQTERFREGSMGWGLRAAERISKGQMIIEYLGELIDSKEMERRMIDQRKFMPSDHDFYIMELDDGVYVDGKHMGNESRFINHSCNPNCELQLWQIKGSKHIAITAIKNIEPGESLSYDYQFETNEEDIFQCHCGSFNCRGTMAPKKKIDRDLRNLDRLERNKLVRLHRGKLRNLPMDIRRQDEWTLSCTGKLLPGDTINEVQFGSTKNNFPFARSSGLFLPRNTSKTASFVFRRQKLWLLRNLCEGSSD